MKLDVKSTIMLPGSVSMPRLGLGVYKIPEGQAIKTAVCQAITLGYRHFDTASFYGNEHGLGTALSELIADGAIRRDEVFITTKIWNTDHGYDAARRAIDTSQKLLSLGFIDLHLIHWPIRGMFTETWRALEMALREGQTRAIGVSNFLVSHLETLFETAKEPPAVNQIEFHPWLQQPELQAYCHSKNITLCAWSPLMRGACFSDPVIQSVAHHYKKTPAQIVLRWELQKGIVTIPKTIHIERMEENISLFDFELSPGDILALDKTDRGHRSGLDPATF